MGSYRVYLVAAGGRLQLGPSFEARDDPAAIERAREGRPSDQAAELWQGGRLVGHFSSRGQFTLASKR